MDMEQCRVTKEQIKALAAGEKVKIEWETAGEYGWVDSNEMILVLKRDPDPDPDPDTQTP